MKRLFYLTLTGIIFLSAFNQKKQYTENTPEALLQEEPSKVQSAVVTYQQQLQQTNIAEKNPYLHLLNHY